jgi:transmembrane sensor
MSVKTNDINQQATEWLGKRSFRELTPEEAAEFDAWLAADSRHLGAYGMAEAALARVQCAFSNANHSSETEVSTGEPFTNAVAIANETPKWTRRRLLLTGSVAASAAGLTAAALWAQEETFSTALGETREVVLSDGSKVVLNTSSKIAVRYTMLARDVHLLQGEALFDVAKNKYRPFTVSANGTNVRAVGTSFAVLMLPQMRVHVLVREGVIELSRPGNGGEAAMQAGANTVVASPHDGPMSMSSVTEAQVGRFLAWRYGRIAFDSLPLHSAAEEYARYSEVRIIVDPAIAHRKITGLFASNDPIGFAKVAATVLQLQVEVTDRTVRIFPPKRRGTGDAFP